MSSLTTLARKADRFPGVNRLLASLPILYPLKTLENLVGIKWEHWSETG